MLNQIQGINLSPFRLKCQQMHGPASPHPSATVGTRVTGHHRCHRRDEAGSRRPRSCACRRQGITVSRWCRHRAEVP